MTLDIGAEFGSSETASVDGVWVPLGGDAEIKVSRLGNPSAQKAYRQIPRPLRRQIEDGTFSNEQSNNFLSNFMADHLVKDWRNIVEKVVDSKGNESLKKVPFSIENAKKMFKKFRRFRDRIWEIASDEDIFNTGVEEDSKNLQKASGGT